MHRRTASAIVLGLSALTLVTLPSCSPSPTTAVRSGADSAAPLPDDKGDTKQSTVPMSSAQLRERLLDTEDLGAGYTLKPDSAPARGDVTVTGCPAVERLGSDAASSGGLDFPRSAKAAFTYNGDSEVTEELFSDSAAKLSQGAGRVFGAITACPSYQVITGVTPVDVSVKKRTAPPLGDERWSMEITYTAGGQATVVRQTAIRTGTTLVVLAGSPALVETHIDKALAKARHTT